MFKTDNFIHINKGALSKKDCDDIIEYFEDNSFYHEKGGITFNHQEEQPSNAIVEEVKKSTDLVFQSVELKKNFWMPFTIAMKKTIDQYVNRYPFLRTCRQWDISHTFRIQKYLPNEGFFALHAEHTGVFDGVSERRLAAWMVYLNDVIDGGGTDFPTLDYEMQARVGDISIWPAYWTHPHRGITSPTETKYIITGWFSYKKMECELK